MMNRNRFSALDDDLTDESNCPTNVQDTNSGDVYGSRGKPSGKANPYAKRKVKVAQSFRNSKKAIDFAVSELVMSQKSFDSEITGRTRLITNGRLANGWVLSLYGLRKYCLLDKLTAKATKEQKLRAKSKLDADKFNIGGQEFSRTSLYLDRRFAGALKYAYRSLSTLFTGLHLRTDGKLSVKFFFSESSNTVAPKKTATELFEEKFIACRSKAEQDKMTPPRGFSSARLTHLQELFGAKVPQKVNTLGHKKVRSKKDSVEDFYQL